MEFVFLGTSAGEQYPGFWCKCENCQKARELGGRNIRRNSCAWLSPDTLLDFSPGVFAQADRFGVPIIEARHLIVTHSHDDHLGLFALAWRGMKPDQELPPPHTVVGPRFSPLPTLHIVGNEAVCEAVRGRLGDGAATATEIRCIEPYRPHTLGPMTVTPMLANHPDRDGRGYNYVVEREGRTLLYALDTGWFLPETLAEIGRHRYDLVVLEGTFGYGAEDECHMNFRKAAEARRLFGEKGLLKPGALFCLSHICPHFTPVHDEIAPIMAEQGITIAYDGMRIEL